MVERFILNELKHLIEQGEDILESRERTPHIYDMPAIDEDALKPYKTQYKEWRSAYDEIIAQLEMRGVAMNISKITAEEEQLAMFLNVRDILEQNRNITNKLEKHMKELREILEGIDYVEIDVLELIDGYKRTQGYDDKGAYEKLKDEMLTLLKNNPKKRYVIDLRKMNIGDYDLLENIAQLMFAPHSEERIILELRNQEDATIVDNQLHKIQRNLPKRIETHVCEVEPAIIMYVKQD